MKNNTKSSFIVGCLLGDSSIDKSGVFQIGHGIAQKEYLLYKKSILDEFFESTYYERDIVLGSKTFIQCGIKSKVKDYFKHMRRVMYTPSKTITRDILNKLSPLGLAIWYLDDGSLVFNKTKEGLLWSRKGFINTQGFSYEEHKIFVEYFKQEHNIDVKIHRDKKYYRLYLNSTELKKLIAIIEEHVPYSMKYKICMRYGAYKKSENLCGKECSKNCPYEITNK